MRKLILLAAGIIATLSSCKSYLMSTVSTTNNLTVDSTGIFNLENDSVKISYSFSGDNTPMNVVVFNKLNEPLYVNWQRSALVVNDQAYSFVDDHIQITGETSSSSIQYNNSYRFSDSYSYGNINAQAKLSKDESFVPPKSKVDRTTYTLNQLQVNQVQDSLYKKSALNYSDGSGVMKVKTASFTAGNSPLKFRSYLTMYTLKNNQPQPFAQQQEFFISSVTKMGANPDNASDFTGRPGNVIMISKTSGFGKAMTGVAIVGAVGALAVGDAALNKNNNDHK